MTYRVEVVASAVGQVRRLETPARLHVQAAIELLAEQPRPAKAEQISGGTGEWRVRTGGIRLIYDIDDVTEVVRVVALGRPVRAIPRAPRLTVPPPVPAAPPTSPASDTGSSDHVIDLVAEPTAEHPDEPQGRIRFWRRQRS